ncbi:MAG: hypothetical protein PUI89_03815, partial [Bacteroidales bacterium]|uniref:hypothetical protein n=1 Tax=Porphyromonas sp. TaxID=1924944 RepID=UPI002A7EA657
GKGGKLSFITTSSACLLHLLILQSSLEGEVKKKENHKQELLTSYLEIAELPVEYASERGRFLYALNRIAP